jgi:hypothetical protein
MGQECRGGDGGGYACGRHGAIGVYDNLSSGLVVANSL